MTKKIEADFGTWTKEELDELRKIMKESYPEKRVEKKVDEIKDKIIICKAVGKSKIRCYDRYISQYVEGRDPIFRNVDKVSFDGSSIQVENNTPIICKVNAGFINCVEENNG